MYADDTTLYCNIIRNGTADVNSGELLKINQWLKANKLSLMYRKLNLCFFIRITNMFHTPISKLMAIKSIKFGFGFTIKLILE